MEVCQKTSIKSFFSKEFYKQKAEYFKGYVFASKGLSFYPVFMLYAVSIVFLIKLTEVLLRLK